MDRRTDRRTLIAGVGMTTFERPKTKKWHYYDMGREAARQALDDAGISYDKIEAAVTSYCYGEPTCGQRALYEIGLSGIPVFNVNNNCSSASSALMLARELVKGGKDCVLALGFEQMESGLSSRYTDKIAPTKIHFDKMYDLGADSDLLPGLNEMTSEVIKIFAYSAREYERKHKSINKRDLAEIALKNRIHGSQNERASKRSQSVPSLEDIQKRTLCEPITLHMASPTADGGAAAIVCSEEFARRNNLQAKAVEIIAQQMLTDLPSTFDKSFMDLCGYRLAQEAARRCFNDAKLTPIDVDVVELHDCFSCNELFMYEALGFAKEGRGMDLFKMGSWKKNKNGGQVYKMNNIVVNPSGGLESKGHPIGATGLGQCAELCWQLRGDAGKRQVEGAKVGLQHNYGIGSACVVTLYKKYSLQSNL